MGVGVKKTVERRGERSTSVTKRQVTPNTRGAAARQGAPRPLSNFDRAELRVKLSLELRCVLSTDQLHYDSLTCNWAMAPLMQPTPTAW